MAHHSIPPVALETTVYEGGHLFGVRAACRLIPAHAPGQGLAQYLIGEYGCVLSIFTFFHGFCSTLPIRLVGQAAIFSILK
jgi:hypothetical protein